MKRPLHKKARGTSGQAAIEFIVVVIVVFFFLFFFLSMSFLFVVSDYIDYATFMAARTYKAGLSSEAIQEQRAQEVFNSYVQKVQGLARNFQPLVFTKLDPQDEQSSGVVSTYDIDLFYLPPLFLGEQLESRITLQSEAHLGREPSGSDCENFFIQFGRRNNLGVDGNALVERMDDTGC